jgi:Ca2+-binding RTX toxin-like protein
MRRILLLTTLAAMLAGAMALSGVAQAKSIGGSADAKCQQLAIKTLGPGFNPADYTFVGGTEGTDNFTEDNASSEVFCGFGGDDSVYGLSAGDIFLGGDGNDSITNINYGTFYGGAGDDSIARVNYGTFYGGAGNDIVGDTNEGTFYGGAGNDQVLGPNYRTFYGGPGDDFVSFNDGTFYGGAGNDRVDVNGRVGTFYGEAGNDQVVGRNEGTFVQ